MSAGKHVQIVRAFYSAFKDLNAEKMVQYYDDEVCADG